MEFIKKNKDSLLAVILSLITLTGIILVFSNRIGNLNYSETKEKALFILISFSYVIFSVCIFFSFKYLYTIFSYFKYLVPVIIGISFVFINKDYNVFVPYILPVIIITLLNDVTIAYVFQSMMCLIYYFTGTFTAEVSIFYMLISVICIYFVKKSDSFYKFIFSGIISALSYVFISYNYQLILYDKVKFNIIIKGLIPLLISILPLYYSFFKKLFYEKIIKKKLKNLCHDENELLLTLNDINPEAYYHSLQVSDTAVKVAKILNCNADIVNAAARFHEIGKLKDGNYVEESIKIMKKDKFPAEVIKIVKEHNSKSHYPKTLESAIVMLSDSIETTLAKVIEKNGYNINHQKIVSQIIDIRFDSGSLDYALKSTKDYKELRNAFLSIY